MLSSRIRFGLASLALVSAIAAASCAKDEGGVDATACVAGVETCNGKDDDCDGYVDEDVQNNMMTRECSNACGTGVETCVSAAWAGCTARLPSEETCNGKDDDCDGVKDNGFECAVGNTQPCGTDVGECKVGAQTCQSSCTWAAACTGGVDSRQEVCEGSKDEDCDGTVDNGCGCTAGQTKDCCGGSQIDCQGGKWPSCPAAPAEICDKVDQDCSGKADDHLPQTPYWIDESSTGLNDCEHAYTDEFVVPIVENQAPKSFDFRLYKPDGSKDRDFFSFMTKEASNAACVANPSDYECYELTVTLTREPTGLDYELCVYDMGTGGNPDDSCVGKTKVCSGQNGNPVNKITFGWEGGCGSEDGHRFVIEVFDKGTVSNNCDWYTIQMGLTGSGPQVDACVL